ncbi:MAG: 5-formyltetrahydrofolate cyclo-ligase [Gammaproteobacteria bacterium]|jgi:5-formyltetrahydrofolate cyclo-ligase
MSSKSDQSRDYSSPPCFAHELEYTADGFETVDPVKSADVARWRKAQRERLIAFRQALSKEERHQLTQDTVAEIQRWVEPVQGLRVSVFWPYRAEPGLQELMSDWRDKGVRVALPVVVDKQSPMIFREWTAGCKMERAALNIPVPVNTAELSPDVVIAPLVGFDRNCYRLGYGGGFFDRTLAALSQPHFSIGIGHPGLELATIYPQAHDVPMDIIITGKGRVREREAV